MSNEIIEIVNKLYKLVKKYKNDEILEFIYELEKSGYELPPNILVLKGMSIQLAGSNTIYDIDDAEHAFRRAIEMDCKYVDAILELAWFLYTVRRDTTEAMELFEKALAISRHQAAESVNGIAQCLLEKEGAQIALKYLDEQMNPDYSLADSLELSNTKNVIMKCLK